MNFYLEEYDVKGINPFIHYLKYGLMEGNIPKLLSIDELKVNNLKLTLKGKNNYYFLINDANSEILQHFDKTFKHKFNPESFSEDYSFKKELFNKNGIKYGYFIVPDKSVICKDYLPFNWNSMQRNLDKIEEIPDFSSDLNAADFFPYDTHMNFEGGKIFAYNLIHYLNPSFTKNDYENLLSENGQLLVGTSGDDLLSDTNWSYSNEEKNNIKRNKCVYLIPTNSINSDAKIPEEFRFCHERRSLYYINRNPKSNCKVLILHDSSIIAVYNYLLTYFKEVFLYWDHGTINEDLINWFNPDIILEIRIERFLERLIVPEWVKNRENIFKTDGL